MKRRLVPADFACAVVWAQIPCGSGESLQPDPGVVKIDPAGQELVFRSDGTATIGDVVFRWFTWIQLPNRVAYKRWSIWADRVLFPGRIEAQRMRLLGLSTLVDSQWAVILRELREAGPVIGTSVVHGKEWSLCSRPSGSDSVSFGSPHGDEVERNDLAARYCSFVQREHRAVAAIEVADKLLLLAIRRHLPAPSMDDVRTKRIASVRVNGRTYWMVAQLSQGYGPVWDSHVWPGDDVVEVVL